MIAAILITPPELQEQIRQAAQKKRLSLNLSQKTVAERSGVSLGSLKKFEHTGKISLESLLKIALVLESLEEFTQLFKPQLPQEYLSLDELLQEKNRERGRQ